MKLKIIKCLKKKLKELFKNENTGHDISHLKRVFDNALKIQKNEGGDLYVVAVSALVHDIHRIMSTQQRKFVSPEESLEKVEKILIDCNVDKTKLNQILEVVKHHDDKDIKNLPLETLIIQDADILDAIGKIGLKRTLTFCKTHNIPKTSSTSLDCKEYIPDLNPISTCHYIYRTMIPNANNIYTQTAKKLAKDKIAILEHFLKKHL